VIKLKARVCGSRRAWKKHAAGVLDAAATRTNDFIVEKDGVRELLKPRGVLEARRALEEARITCVSSLYLLQRK
jgi:hypothetical protein